MYKVIKFFTDMQDDNFAYNVGDVFPRENKSVTDERIEELATTQNRQKKPLIKKVEEKPKKSKKTNKE